jgi:Bacillithiol biosynthesis BshC
MTPTLRLKVPSPADDPSAAVQNLAAAMRQGRFLAHAAFSEDNARARRLSLASRTYDRATLSDWLGESFSGKDAARQGAQAGAHAVALSPTEAQSENLKAAASDASLFVLTGQQPGLLGGPLLAYLKALSAVAMAKQQSAVLGVPVIPIFWVAGDDSDLAEANAAEFLWESQAQGGSGLSCHPLHLPFEAPHRKLPVGDRPITAAADAALRTGMPETWPAALREAIAEAYAPSSARLGDGGNTSVTGTLVTGFLALMQKALGHTGLLFVDANSPRLRRLTQKPLSDVIGRSQEFFDALARGEQALFRTLGLKPQVVLPPGALPGFARQNGERMRLYATEKATSQAGAGVGVGVDVELQHDALTRMVVTESVLPVLGHVLGPAEMRYAAQLAQVFARFTGGMPLLHPRQSALLVPEAVAAVLDAHGMAAEQWPGLTPSAWRAHLRQRVWRQSDASLNPPTAWFAGWRDQAGAWLARHMPAGEKAGGTGGRGGSSDGDNGGGKPSTPLEAFERSLRGDLLRLERTAQEALARRLSPYRDATRLLRPLACGAGQERHLNLMSVWAALGDEGMRGLEAGLDPLFTGTQIFTFGTPDGDKGEEGDDSNNERHAAPRDHGKT